MKILILNSEYPPIGGGAANASANISRLLAQLGNEVLILPSHYGELPQDEIDGGVRILRIRSLRRREDRSNALEQISFILTALVRTRSLVRDFKPAVTLAFFGLPSGAVAWWLKKISKIP